MIVKNDLEKFYILKWWEGLKDDAQKRVVLEMLEKNVAHVYW